MALARWNGVVQDAEGNAVSGAQIEVRNEATGGLAPLYSDRDGTVGLGNPYVASGPDIAFHARGGNYRITASKGTELKTWRWVAIGTSQGVDVEDLIVGLQAGIITAQTLAELDANAPETPDPGITPAPRGGVVWNDPNPALNGYYTYNYAATEWEYARPLPDTFAKVLLSGTGTAQTGVLAAGVSPAGIEVFFAKVVVPNTGALTLSINGGPARQVVNLAGNPLSAGEWTGMVMFYLNEGNQYQLLIDAGAAQAAAASASFADERADDAEAAATRAENAASSFSEVGTNFKTVTNLLADTTLGYTGSGAATEVATGDIVTAQGFRYEVVASGATDAHVETAGGVKLYVLPLGDRMYFASFGLVGGDTDETALLQKAFTAGAGYELRAGRAQTYRSTESLQLLANTDLNLRGSTINFACVGQKRNLEVYGNNVTVRKGRVRNVVGSAGFEGSFQTPIVIGRYQELAGFRNVVVEDMTVETVLPSGNGIAIFGDSENIDIRRISYPNSSYIGIPIMAHWSFNTAEVNLGGPKKTTHQKNLRINNIWCGTLSLIPSESLYFNTSVVFLSAVYSAEVSNITIENSSRGKAVTVYAGDWGFQYAQKTNEVALGSRSISVKNIYGRCFSGVEVYMKNPLDAPLVPWPVQVSFDNVNLLGYGAVSSSSRGFLLSACEDVSITNSDFDGFYYGGYPSVDVKRFRLRDSTIKNSRASGILAGGNGVGCEDWSISDNHFINNNAASVASSADIRLYGVVGVDLDDNTFDSPLATWNLRLEGGATTVRHAKVRGNHSKNVLASAGPCFSFGSSGDTAIADVFRDNVADVIPTNGLKGGQTLIGFVSGIAAAPQFIGQEAYSAGNIYRATNTTSPADWKQIT